MRLITTAIKRVIERISLEIERARVGNKRSLAFAVIVAAAALIAAFCVIDASADAIFGNRPTVQRAGAAAW